LDFASRCLPEIEETGKYCFRFTILPVVSAEFEYELTDNIVALKAALVKKVVTVVIFLAESDTGDGAVSVREVRPENINILRLLLVSLSSNVTVRESHAYVWLTRS